MAKQLFIMAESKLNRKIARMPGVRDAVGDYAKLKEREARAILNAHRDTGNSYVEMKQGKVDAVISLVDPPAIDKNGVYQPGNARAIEFGHRIKRGGKIIGYARGLHAITGPVFGWS